MPRARAVRAVAAMVAALLVVLVGGWAAARQSVSPRQRASQAEPPAARPVTATVERRVLSQIVIVRGDVVAQSVTEVKVAPPEGAEPVVTEVRVSQGDTVAEGQVLLAVADRPILALAGRIASYRDLHNGDTGTDVRQLQAALRRLGLRIGDRDGEFGAGTEAAITALWRRGGFAPPLEPAPPAPAADPPASGADQTPAAGKNAAPAPPPMRVWLPRSEVVFVSALPAVVAQLNAPLGRAVPAEGGALSLASGDVVVRCRLEATESRLIRDGQQAVIEDAAMDLRAEGSVGGVSRTSTPEGEREAADVRPSTPLGVDLIGRNVKVSITAETSGAPVLAVPIAAMRSGADGQSRVEVVRGAANHDVMVVTTGVVAGGWVEIREAAGALSEGDEVVVG